MNMEFLGDKAPSSTGLEFGWKFGGDRPGRKEEVKMRMMTKCQSLELLQELSKSGGRGGQT